MKKVTAICLFVAGALLLISCKGKGDNDLSDSNENLLNYEAFINLLSTNGFTYDEGDVIMAEDSFLSVECRRVFIGDEPISVYEYTTNESMEEDSNYISSDGTSIRYLGKHTSISWVSYPHFYKKDLIIINYVGENDDILDFLNESLGNEFAGSGLITTDIA